MTVELLAIEDLTVDLPGDDGCRRPVLRGVSLALQRGEIVGLVGESGCGKTLTALAVLRLLPPAARVVRGRIRFDGEDLMRAPEHRLRRLRGLRIGMVFQEPMTALNPVLSIGFQIAEAIRVQSAGSSSAARLEAARLLDLVAMPDGGERLGDYPHQLSGGQRQRVMIAMALACRPDLLIADEPTTALDVTLQAEILELLRRLRQELDLTVLLITHDMGVVAETCDRVAVMHSGQVVETATVDEIFAAPAHQHTQRLLAAIPRPGQEAAS
jgi:ABC-type dipeptide/oligopeptide/nickel transport system ATPase component